MDSYNNCIKCGERYFPNKNQSIDCCEKCFSVAILNCQELQDAIFNALVRFVEHLEKNYGK